VGRKERAAEQSLAFTRSIDIQLPLPRGKTLDQNEMPSMDDFIEM
jgi:hypothetical protein